MVDNNRALVPAIDWATLEKVVVEGDIAALTPEERLRYYRTVCESLGLNPATQPFAYVNLKGKLTLYALKGATDQLRRIYHVSIPKIEKERDGDLFTVTAYATTPDGRQDADMGAVSVKGLAGEALANAYLKAITKAKRRVTLSICGLGMLDETEVDSIPGAVKMDDQADQSLTITEHQSPPKRQHAPTPPPADAPSTIEATARTKEERQSSPTPPPTAPTPPAAEPTGDDALSASVQEHWIERINAADSLAALTGIATELKAEPEAAKNPAIRAAYKARLDALNQAEASRTVTQLEQRQLINAALKLEPKVTATELGQLSRDTFDAGLNQLTIGQCDQLARSIGVERWRI